MAVREFDGVDDVLDTATGSLATNTFGAFAIIVKRGSTGSWDTFCALHDSGANALNQFAYNDSNLTALWANNQSHTGPAAIGTADWGLIVVRKDSGTTAARFSLYNFTTATWTHSDASGSHANWTGPGASGTVRFRWVTFDLLGGRVAVRGAWNSVPWNTNPAGDSALEAAGLELSLQNWTDAAPDALWAFNQTAVTDPVTDLTGGGADQTAITGTTVITGDDPPGFDFGGGGGVTGTGEATPAAAQVSGSGTVAVTATGAATAPAANIIGSGAVVVTGSGALDAPPVAASGSGPVTITGAGAAAEPPAVATGTGAPVTTLFARDSQTGAGTGGDVYDLSSTQGSPAGDVAGSTSSDTFVEVLRFQTETGDRVTSTSFPVSVDVTGFDEPVLGSGEARWRLQRLDSTNTVVASSDYAPIITATGVHTATLTLDTTWQSGDRLGLSVETRRSSGTTGSVTITVATQDVDSHVDVTLAGVLPISSGGQVTAPAAGVDGIGSVAISGSGAATAPAAEVSGTGGVVIAGTGQLDPAAAAVSGSGSIGEPAVTGNGTATPPAATTSGSGTVAITASGAATAGAVSISGAGTVTIDGAGTIVTPAALITGAGAVVIAGSGALTAPAASVSGSAHGPIAWAWPIEMGVMSVKRAVSPGTVTVTRAVQPGTVTVERAVQPGTVSVEP